MCSDNRHDQESCIPAARKTGGQITVMFKFCQVTFQAVSHRNFKSPGKINEHMGTLPKSLSVKDFTLDFQSMRNIQGVQ